MLRNIITSNSVVQSFLKLPTNISVQAVRTTFILKRRYEPRLNKTNYQSKKLRAKHFIYDLVQDSLVIKRKNVEVILKTYVEGIGKKGDVVSLKPTYAYNNLILPGLATFKTEENLKEYSQNLEDSEETKHSSAYAQRTVNKLERLILGIVMNKNEPWTIEPWHIRASLRKAGYQCTDECIELPKEKIHGPDLTKQNKEFNVIVTINNLEKANLKCRIHHWSTDPSERLPYMFEHWKNPAEPLQFD